MTSTMILDIHHTAIKINDTSYTSYVVIDDMVIAWDKSNRISTFFKDSLDSEVAEAYQINSSTITDTMVFEEHGILVFVTIEASYFRDFENNKIENSEKWEDFYFEPYTKSMYRKDFRGVWCDLEGTKIDCPIFLKNDVLCSLDGKVSKNGLGVLGGRFATSLNFKLVQIGNVVLDYNLNFIPYFGERISGLIDDFVQLSDGQILQAVSLSTGGERYICESSLEPFLINKEEVIGVSKTLIVGTDFFVSLKTKNRNYIIKNTTNQIIRFEDEFLNSDLSFEVELRNNSPVVYHKCKKGSFTFDLKIEEPILVDDAYVYKVLPESILINERVYYNVETTNGDLCFDPIQNTILRLNNDTIVPTKIQVELKYKSYFAYAFINGIRKLFSIGDYTIVQLGVDRIEISELVSQSNQLLLNAISINGEKVVIDARGGYNVLKLGICEATSLNEVIGDVIKIGNSTIQNALINSLGGSEKRVVVLDGEDLIFFRTPSSLKQFSDQAQGSTFAENIILEIDAELIEVLDSKFFSGKFKNSLNQVYNILLQYDNGYPLHFEGFGHRNELILDFLPKTLEIEFQIGNNRILGVKTLTEEYQESELLFSLNKMTSWIPFYDTYLPILKKAIDNIQFSSWMYILYEVKSESLIKEYLVVEKASPNRVLVEDVKGAIVPLLMKSKTRSLKNPEEISALERVFMANPGFLIETDDG